jgi:hypothetical protein
MLRVNESLKKMHRKIKRTSRLAGNVFSYAVGRIQSGDYVVPRALLLRSRQGILCDAIKFPAGPMRRDLRPFSQEPFTRIDGGAG